MKLDSGLVLALDVLDRKRALEVAQGAGPVVDAVKVGLPLVLSCGTEIVREIGRSSWVLCDFKVADIPNTNRLITSEAFRAGARGLIAHCFAGKDSLTAVVEEARRHGGEVFAVTEMSHPGALDFLAPQAEKLAAMAAEAGAAGIIAPATRPEKVTALRGIVGDLKILSPGVGAQGGSAASAVLAGADAVIVGRSIYESPDPALAAEALAREVREARRQASLASSK